MLAHVALLAAHGHDAVVAVVLAMMTVVCAGCAVKVWRTPDRRILGTVMGMSLAMAVAHVALTLGPLSAHHAATGTVTAAVAGSVGATRPTPIGSADVGQDPAAMLAVAALDVVIAWVAALAVRLSATPPSRPHA